MPDPPGFASADPAAAHSAHIAAVLDARAGDADALRAAADDLDRIWRADEARGLCDLLGGVEYHRLSRAPRLRALADKIDPPMSDPDD